MALDPTRNFAYGLVEAGGHSAAATSFNTVSGTGAKFPATADGAFNVVWWNITDYTNPAEDPNAEIVRVTARSGEAFTVTRAQESTSASTKNTTGKVYAIALCVTKKMIDDISTLLADAEDLLADATALVAGLANASTTAKGQVEIATEAEVLAGTATGGTGASLVVTPDVLQKVLQGQASTFFTEDGTGSDDTYTATVTPTPTAYVTGQAFRGKFTIANTTACTLNLSSLGAKSIKKYVSGSSTKAELETGDIVANETCFIVYDGTDFVLLNPSATMPTTALLSEMATFFGATDISGAEAETLTSGISTPIATLHAHKKSFLVTSRDTGAANAAVTYAHGLGAIPNKVMATVIQGFSNGGNPFRVSFGVYDRVSNTHGIIWSNGQSAATSATDKLIAVDYSGAGREDGAVTAVDATNVTITWTASSSPTSSVVPILLEFEI